jgi:hypothetical protein
LIALIVLALGLVGASLSTLYEHDEYSGLIGGTFKASYGFPLGWYGYSTNYGGAPLVIPLRPPVFYWFSLEAFLLDVAFWFGISFFVSLVAIKVARALNLVEMARAGVLGMKTSIMLLVMSLFFIVVGVGLSLVNQMNALGGMSDYLNVGSRLIGSGAIALIATLSDMLWKAEQRQRALRARAYASAT